MTRDEEIVVFHYQLGVAITEWSHIEGLLRDVLVYGFKDEYTNRESLSIGVFKLEGFRAKLNFIDGTVTRKLQGSTASQHTPAWTKLVHRARTLADSRNKLAHWPIDKYWDCPPGQRVVLRPWLSAKKRRLPRVPRPPAGALHLREIMKIHLEFKALAVSLANFLYRACNAPAPHQESDEQAGRPLTVPQLARQIREVLGVKQRPSERKS
jgi:hypothetical protein